MKRCHALVTAIVIAAGLADSPLWAQSEIWATNTAGYWSSAFNWSGGTAYAGGPDQTADFSVLSGNTAVADDLAANTIGYMVFGMGAGSLGSSVSTNTLTLQTTAPGSTPAITVGGNTTTMTLALAGSQGFVLSGGGNLTFSSAASLPTGPVTVNAGTLQFSGTASTATTFIVNNGATLNVGTDVNLGSGATLPSSVIYVSSAGNPTATIGGSGFQNGSTSTANQMQCTLTGNGNINWNFSNLNIISGNLWQSYGGIVNWGSDVNGFRAAAANITVNAQFAEINLGTATASLSDKSGDTATFFVGALAGGAGTSLQSSVAAIEGMANLSTSWSGVTAGPFTKIGTGTLILAPTAAWTSTTLNVNGGILQLNYANHAGGVLATTDAPTFTGGTLYLLGNTAGASSQTLGNATVNAGDGTIVVNPNGGSGTTLALGTITSTAVGGGLNFTVMPGPAAVTSTSGTLADGTLGGRITYTSSAGATDFATVSGGTIGAYANYAGFVTAGALSTTDYALVGGSTLTASETGNLLKISTSGAGQSLSGNVTLTVSGALLFTGSNNYSINTSGFNSMFWTSGGSANADILIHNYGTGSLTIAAKMNNNNGAATLTLDGPGTTILTNTNNSFNGSTYINGATLSTNSALVLGGTGNSTALNMFGGTFQATQSFALNNGTANHNVVIGGGGGTFDVTAGNTLTVGGVVSNLNTSNVGPLVKVDSGTLVLPNSNTYTGATILSGGVLSVSSLANGLSASGIGASSAAAPALVFNGGVLQYTGPGASTDRSFVLTNNGGGIDASGTGPLTFSATSTAMLVSAPIVAAGPLAGSGTRLFTLTGTNAGQNVFAGQIVDGTGGATSLAKTGPGQWVLTNNNTYSGGTTVTAGTLSLASALSTNNIASSSPISVGGGSVLNAGGLANATLALTGNQTLTGAGTVAGSLTAPAFAAINPGAVMSGNAGTGTLAISGGLSISGNSTVNFGLTGTSGTANLVSVGGTLGLPTSGAPVNVNLYTPNTSSPFLPASGTTTYDLFQFGSLTGSLSELSVANGVGAYTYSFGTVAIGGADYVQLSATLINVVATWSNTGAGNWSAPGNWSGGVPQTPGDSALFSAAITSSATVTLDHVESVGSIAFSNTNSYTISGTNTLTLSGPSGASLSDTLGSHTIAVPLNLAANMAVSVANGGVLTLSGGLSGAGALTKNGNGTLTLASSNGYGPAAGSVGTTLNAGTLRLGNNAALSTGDLSAAGNGALQAGANGLILNNNIIIGSGITATVDTQGNTLTLAGLVSESAPSGSLAVIGNGTLILSNSNTYTGTTTITSAALQLDNGGSTGYVGGPIVNNGGLALDRGDTGLTLSSVISGSGSLAQIGAGMSTLNAANTFSGQTTISAGTLQLANSLALQESTLNYNNQNGTLSFGGLSTAALGGLSGSQSLPLLNSSGGGVAMTVGNNSLSTTYSGVLSGAGGSLTKAGNGTTTLTGSNSYSGTTTVNAGALVVSSGGLIQGSSAVVNAGSLLVQSGGNLNTATTVTGGMLSVASAGSIESSTTTVSGGVLLASSGGSFNSAAAIALSNGTVQVSGGTLVAPGINVTIPGYYTQTSGLGVLNGNLTVINASANQPYLFAVSGGSLAVNGNINLGRCNITTAMNSPLSQSTADGLFVNGGTVSAANLMEGGTANSSIPATINSGALVISGQAQISDATGGRWSVLDVNGGALTVSDTVNGVVLGVQTGATSSLVVDGTSAIATVGAISFGSSSAGVTAGQGEVYLSAGGLYVGAGGINQGGGGSYTSTMVLAGGTLGATAPWSESAAVPVSLAGSSAPGITVQTGDRFGNGNAITINGAISGTGGMTITGTGGLVLTNPSNNYSGNTLVSAGTLALNSPFSSNNIPSSPLIAVAASAVLDSTGLSNATLVLGTSQTLTGAGAVNGSLTASTQSTIIPGTVASGLAGSGSLSVSGGLSLWSGSFVNFGLSNSNSAANIVNVGGTLTLPSSDPVVNINLYVPSTATAFVPTGGAVYDLFQYGSLSGSLSELAVANASGLFTYSFGTAAVGSADYVQLTITQGSIWTLNGPGNWSSPGNWSAAVPQNPGDIALFSGAITSPVTVTLDQPESVGSVGFSNSNSYTISGTNTLTLSSTTGGAFLSVALGTHTIAVPLTLAVNTATSVANGGVLTLSGQVSGPGTLTTSGNGTLVLSASNGYGPAAGSVGTTLNAGTVQVGDSASLSTGDVSVAGNATVQAGANGLVLANNFIIAPGATATFDTQGKTLTLPGLISESSPSGSLAVIGTGTVILTGANTYSGTTTITSATLQLDNGGSAGYVGGPIVDNGALVLDRGDTNLTLSSVISGSGSLTQIGLGMSTLNAANTFSGNTTISAGTLQLGNPLALQDSTLVYNNPNGTLSFGVNSAASVGALTGSLSMALQNTFSSAVALEVGNNVTATSATYSGNFSGPGSLEWDGPGSWTLTGSSSIAAGLQMSNNSNLGTGGNLILPAGSSLSVASLASYGVGGTNLLTVSGGTLNVAGLSFFNGKSNNNNGGNGNGNGGLSVSGGLVNLSGGLNIATDNPDANVLVRVSGGTVNTGTITIGRNATTSYNTTNYPTMSAPTFVGLTNAGFYITAGVLDVTGNINVGSSTNAPQSTVSFRMDGGAVDVSGPIGIGLNNLSRWSVFDVNGGSLVDSDTTSGIAVCGVDAGNAEFLVRAGVANVQLVTFGIGGGGTGVLNLTGGQLYVGAGGLVAGSADPQIYLSGGTLGATAPWSSALPMSLTGNATTGVTIQAGDPFGNPQSITLSSSLSGNGALTLGGGGTGGVLTLLATNTYHGATILSEGTLQLGNGLAGQDGSLAGTSGVTDNAALVFDLAGTQAPAYAIGGSGSLAMVGPGTLYLTGTNMYTGGTTVEGGMLVLSSPTALEGGTSLMVGGNLGAFTPIILSPPAGSAAVAAVAVAAVPEPGTLALLAAGAAAALLWKRRQKAQRRR
jgi:fibronectin-binding autotransporter adhesin